jgi:hypothetical protein
MLQQVSEYIEMPETEEKDPETHLQPDLEGIPEEGYI